MSTTVRIGTSGYSFEDWRGILYPHSLRSKDMLNFYASRFDTVELNYTYYAMPKRHSSQKMVEQVPPGFQFFIKANKSFTHEYTLGAADDFLKGIEPFPNAGMLGGLLFQFPRSFQNTKENRDYIKQVVQRFADLSPSIEFRHRSWAARFVWNYFTEKNLTLVIPDVPDLPELYPAVITATSDTGYIRFHSRNSDLWYAGKAQRYDYNYSEDELKKWLPLLDTIAKRSPTIYTFFNNCHRGQAALNALAFQELIEKAGTFTTLSKQQNIDNIQGGLWT